MVDYAETARKAKLREWAAWVDGIEDRLAQAKERLGDKWLFHPANRIQRREVPYGGIK
jgi:hypothetical protein